MPSKKSANENESVTRLRDLLKQLKTARRSVVDLTEQARREVGDAMGNAGLRPVAPPGAPPARRVRKKQKKR
jgi:hypothetical protein